MSDRSYRALAGFRHALRIFLRFSEEQARRAGLTPAQHQLLLTIKGWAGRTDPSMSDIAEQLQLRLHSTLELVQRAESAGLVRRQADGDDGRRSLVSLTALGEHKLAELSVVHRDELRRFRGELNAILHELD